MNKIRNLTASSLCPDEIVLSLHCLLYFFLCTLFAKIVMNIELFSSFLKRSGMLANFGLTSMEMQF